jgi:uncharacterized glyoxalase superfamily protein PhnB
LCACATEMSLGPAIVMLRSGRRRPEPSRSLPASGSLICCAVEEVDALHERACEAGAEIPLEPMDTEYGSCDFTVRDPEGNLWAFGTYRPRVGED